MNHSNLQLNEKRTLMIMKVIGEGEIFLTPFLKSIGIHRTTFDKHVSKISEKYPLIYEDYMQKRQDNMIEFGKRCKKIISIMEEMIVDGIELEDGSVREFDLIDWYYLKNRYFNNCSRTYIMKLIEEKDKEADYNESRAVHARSLISSSYSNNFGCVDRIITSKHIENDICYGLNDEEKRIIIEYFSQNRIPYTLRTFECAVKRIRKFKEQNEEKSLNNCFKIRIR